MRWRCMAWAVCGLGVFGCAANNEGADDAGGADAVVADGSRTDAARADASRRDGAMDAASEGGTGVDGGGDAGSRDCGDCDDGIACTRDVCTDGVCRHEPDDAACGTGERCFPGTGCQVPPECGDDTVCDDGLFCNGAERCMDGRCEPGSAPCSGGTPYCEEDADRCVACRNDAHCDDGLACNGAERCDGGRCVSGAPIACDDELACTTDRCMEPTGACVHEGADRDGDGHVAAGCGAGDDCDDEDAAIHPGADERCNVADDDCDGTCDEGLSGCRRPIHRMYNGRDFMPSRSTTEGTGVGYSLNRANVYYVYTSEIPGVLAAGYRCYNSSTGDHFIAGSPTCEGKPGYVMEAPVGYGLPPTAPPRCGSVVLKRYYNPSTGDRIASPHPDEWSWAESNGYVFDGDVGQVWLSP